MRSRHSIRALTLVVAATALSTAQAALPAPCVAALRSRAPHAIELTFINAAFSHDKRKHHHHSIKKVRVVEVRLTRRKPSIARVFFLRPHSRKLRSDFYKRGRDRVINFKAAAHGKSVRIPQWKPMKKVPAEVKQELKPVPYIFSVTFFGSGTDDENGTEDPNQNQPGYCKGPGGVGKSHSEFKWHVEWSNVVTGVPHSHGDFGGFLSGFGKEDFRQSDGCYDGNGTIYRAPKKYVCSTSFAGGDAYKPGTAPSAPVRLSDEVDAHNNHKLLVGAPYPKQTNPECGAPAEWEYDGRGPVFRDFGPAISDEDLAQGNGIDKPVYFDWTYRCAFPDLAGASDRAHCDGHVSWTGRIRLDVSTSGLK